MRRAAFLVVVLALALAACGGGDGEAESPASADGAVVGLDNVLDLRADFEADAGRTRVLLLFSPT